MKTNYEFLLNAGSDFICEFTVPDEGGEPADLTGWTVGFHERHAAIAALTPTVLDAQIGLVRLDMAWPVELQDGRNYSFRLLFISPTGQRVTWPEMWFRIQ